MSLLTITTWVLESLYNKPLINTVLISSKRKMSLSAQGKHNGIKNGSFGTCWVTNGHDNKKIKKDMINKYMEMGYTCGRI